MSVFRVHKTKDYTVMSNTHLRDKSITLKAKGLLTVMLSLPDDWDYSILGLAALSKDGKDAIMSALSELREHGYVRMSRVNNEAGKFSGWNYDVFETPNAEIPDTEKPYAENPNTENPPQYNTNSINSSKELTNSTNILSLKRKGKEIPLLEIVPEPLKELWTEFVNMRKSIRHPIETERCALGCYKDLVCAVYGLSDDDAKECRNKLDINNITFTQEQINNAIAIINTSIERQWRTFYRPFNSREQHARSTTGATKVYRDFQKGCAVIYADSVPSDETF